ncbi:MAG: hypothetical protein ACRDD8_08240 [Bacteroidales bacterium]
MVNDIKFWRGRQSDYDKLTPQNNVIYFILDEFKIYLGAVEVSNNKEYFIGTLMSRFNSIIDIFTWNQPDIIIPPKPTYDTDKTYMTFTVSANQTIDISENIDGVTQVNWGDGTIDANTSHTYALAGDYDVIITHTNTTRFFWGYSEYLKCVYSIGKLNTDSFDYCFYTCRNLTTITSELFNNNKSASIFSRCFGYCDSLAAIPSGLFDNCVNATIFSVCFECCFTFTSIPSGLFDKCVNALEFEGCFGGCSGLTSIPSGLFDNCTKVTNFSGCFASCNSLTTIPSNLFTKCVNATNFSGCFSECTALTTISSIIFPNATNFSGCFGDCTSLTTVSINVFANCSNAIDFSYCFSSCSSLVSIPDGLFDDCPNATNFNSCFVYCSSLDQAYNCTTSGLPKLWQRNTEGLFGMYFAKDAHETFRATVDTTWGGTMSLYIQDEPDTLEELEETITITSPTFESNSTTIFTINVKNGECVECGGNGTSYIEWGDGLVSSTSNKIISHKYVKSGEYVVKVLHDKTVSLAIPNSIIRLHNVGDMINLDYLFMFKNNLTSIDTGAFDNCVSVNSLINCFDGCVLLNHAYNLTSPNKKTLWERDGDKEGVIVVDFDAFADNAGEFFRASIPSEWGGTL